jgi:predicted RNA-binding Zn ribbon-like protein
MNTKRTALIGGTAALLLVLTGCAGVDGQFDDSARGAAAAARAESKAQTGLSVEQAGQARAAYERLRELTEARFQAERTERNAATMLTNERIREARQSESTPVTSVQERIRLAKQSESAPMTADVPFEVQELVREAKQAESEPAPQTQQPMTAEQVHEYKASQVK